jgi:eukaryotic-like serine/threonine-protein kinase
LFLPSFSGFKLKFVSGALGATARVRRHWLAAVSGAIVGVCSVNDLILMMQLSEFRGFTGNAVDAARTLLARKQLVINSPHFRDPAMEVTARTRKMRFRAFEVDLRSGEVHKHGIRLRLQDQPFQVLAILLEHAGDVVTREELRQKLWPADTFVDFDTGLNSAIKKLRDVLADSAEEPRYIETLPRRGYRFIAHVENVDLPAPVSIETRLATVPPVGPKSEPRKKRRFIVAAGVAAFLVVAALVAWRVFFARPALTGSDVILLANFVNKTGDPVFDNLDRALEVKLTESPFLSLLPEAAVRQTMRSMRHEPDERVTQELGIEICKRQGLKAVVVPEIDAIGSYYLITLEAIDAQSGKQIARQQQETDNKDKVVAALGKAASQLRRQLGESLSSLQKYNAPLALATTSSLEALQAYQTGVQRNRSGKIRESIPFFERAVELDPQFCSAYIMLGSSYHGIGEDEASRKNFTRAFELKDTHLTQEENFLATATYDWNITGNLEKMNAVLTLYQQVYPRSVNAANLLGINYALLGRKEEALQEFNWTIDHSPEPSAFAYSNKSQALMSLGRFDEAKAIINQWQQKGSLFSYQTNMLYRIAFIENDTATMDRIARQAPPDDTGWLDLQMQFAYLRGDMKKFRSLNEAEVNIETRGGEKQDAADDLSARAQLESLAGNFSFAPGLCRHSVAEDTDSVTELWRCAEAFADASDFAHAEALAAKLNKIAPENTIEQKVHLPLIHSIIARQRGNPSEAADLLLQPEQHKYTLDVPYRLGQAYLASNEPAKAAAQFQMVLDARDAGWWQIYAPLAQLGLARAYSAQADREKSRRAYDDFFATWKDADPDIPVLRQARAEYSRLISHGPAAVSSSGAQR